MKTPLTLTAQSVALVYEEDDGTITVCAHFSSIRSAEEAVEAIEPFDPEGVHAGRYGIDAPEE